MILVWATMIIDGGLTFEEVPTRSQPAVHNKLVYFGYNDDGTPIEGVEQKIV